MDWHEWAYRKQTAAFLADIARTGGAPLSHGERVRLEGIAEWLRDVEEPSADPTLGEIAREHGYDALPVDLVPMDRDLDGPVTVEPDAVDSSPEVNQ